MVEIRVAMFGKEEEAQSVNVTLPSCEFVCVFICTCISMCVFVKYIVCGASISKVIQCCCSSQPANFLFSNLHTYTQHTPDNTAFTRELSVETSLYDDGTVREAEITFTVSGRAIFVFVHQYLVIHLSSRLMCVSFRVQCISW